MKMHARVLALGVGLVVGLGLTVAVAAPVPPDDDKALRETIDQLAEVAAKNPDNLRKEATAAAKKIGKMDDIADEMYLLKKRMLKGEKVTGGWGVGAKPTGKPDDGIEARLINLGKKAPTAAELSRDAADLEQLAYRVAAIAEITLIKAPTKKQGNKDPKDWKEQSEEMSKAALEFAKAVKTKNPKTVKEAASKLNASCTNCHGIFKDS